MKKYLNKNNNNNIIKNGTCYNEIRTNRMRTKYQKLKTWLRLYKVKIQIILANLS